MKKAHRMDVAELPWDADARLFASPPIGGPDQSGVPIRGTLAEIIRAGVDVVLPAMPGAKLTVEYGQDNKSLDTAAIVAAYASGSFPRKRR